ncbi:MAG: YiiX/YebB-like N1pC/P60 family cysteine hydrolase [Candidatus Marinimicrobia bacterium]|nr:YiiX/YebB-like N1pC/P60 family cysteine hydrolase [Candidatus Neomarinimicrobiota bacterium]
MVKIIISILFFFSASQLQADQFRDDIKQLVVFKTALNDMFQDMMYQKITTARHDKGYISNVEHDRIENLLFRFLICRRSLWEIINKYREYNNLYDDPEANMKAFVIGYNASLTLYRYSGILITTYMDDEQIIDKLNESYFRVGIQEGTYAQIFDSLTNPENLEDLDIARELFSNELHEIGTPLNSLLSNPDFSPLLYELDELHKIHLSLRKNILGHYVLLTPEITNKLRHSKIQKDIEEIIKKVGDRFNALKAFVFTEVGDIKSPVNQSIHFSEGQKQKIYSMLQPGDIILTYSEGYLSNIFLPGIFKHGILYTGKRNNKNNLNIQEMGLQKQQLSMIQSTDDIIESVSEGVISNSLNHILKKRINRLVVFRPLVDSTQVIEALRITHSFLGNSYDFSFDFNDASYQVCTEIIYRAYNGMGDIQFELTKRAGVMTLSAEDICEYALKSDKIEFVFLAVESKKAPGEAVLLTGKAGISEIHELIN